MDSLPICEKCQELIKVEKTRRNSQYDLIYCAKCKEAFERRMQMWNCPCSKLKEKENETI